MKTSLLLLGTICVTITLLAGCSGSGVPPGAITGTNLRTVATDHLSVIALMAGWLKVIYFRVPLGVGPTIDVDELLPDGTHYLRGHNSDGSVFENWQSPDGSGHGTQAWGDRSVSEVWGAPVWSGRRLHQEATREWSTGLTMTLDFDGDYSQVGTPQTWSGQATITGGRTMTYTLVRNPGLDHLTLTLPDDTALEFQTPTAPVPGSRWWPQFTAGADAVYAAGGQNLTYHLTGGASQDWWDQMNFTSDAGFTGAFTFDTDFVGAGQLEQGGVLAGSLGWDAQATGRLDLLGAGVEEVTPSAAARDFRLDQWANHTAMMGPAPMY